MGYVDSNYVRDLDKRRSLSGFLFMFGGDLVSWKTNLENVVALSSMIEADYIATTKSMEALCLN